eukprot:15454947-Alexandrium_andersonii.AAC.1
MGAPHSAGPGAGVAARIATPLVPDPGKRGLSLVDSEPRRGLLGMPGPRPPREGLGQNNQL